MENTPILPQENKKEIPQLTPESVSYLLIAAKWAKFLAILGFVFIGLIITVSVFMSFALDRISQENMPINMPLPAVILSIIYVIFSAIFLYPVIMLNLFSNNAIKAVKFSDTAMMAKSFESLKNMFVFYGIAAIVMLIFYLFVIVGAGAVAIKSL